MGKSIYRFPYNYGGCELSVQKIFYSHSRKNFVVPSNPLLAWFCGYIPETQCYQGFYPITKIIIHFHQIFYFAIILTGQGFGHFFSATKME
jgi:hypothetical protein